jgi:hypothetical protein
MSNVLIELDNYDKKYITELYKKCNVTNKITLEDYITTEDLLALIEEVYMKFERLEEDKEELTHQLYHPEDYDERADIYYEERRMEN